MFPIIIFISILLILWISSNNCSYDHPSKRIKVPTLSSIHINKLLSNIIVYVTIVVTFFYISESYAYKSRIVTGFLSIILFTLVDSLNCKNTSYHFTKRCLNKNPEKNKFDSVKLLSIIMLLMLGVYRLLILQGDIWRFKF